ncbi:IclR family transcriptional regulator [Flexivirga meconopsidis]|uniref:IclR family transcriptional regulator n=1 Tax=Flexivirga meconopsidis TaxID=2977121 RepID=UPI002240831D|nr:IclR family transcriptional regulator [Flexivirga meconopsidis]
MTDQAQSRRPGVQAIDRALDLVEALGQGRPRGVSELAGATGLPVGTVHRILATLTERGYVVQDDERKYVVGPSALRLADLSRQSVAAIGLPFARRLTALFGESANVAVQHGNSMVYVAQSPSPHSLRIFAEVGRMVPMHSTAVGKATLAALGPNEASALIDRLDLRAATRHTITDRVDLSAELSAVRAKGFAIDEEEQELGVRCVAAVAPGPQWPYAALSVSGPTERFNRASAERAGPEIAAVARELGKALDGSL